MKTSNLVAAASTVLGITALGMSSAAYALDQCADGNGINQLVTSTCTVDGNGPGIPCSGNDLNNVIIGGNDGLFGDALADILQGGGGVDFLSGADGADTLDGGSPGPTPTGFGDACVGGDGADTLLNCEVAVQ